MTEFIKRFSAHRARLAQQQGIEAPQGKKGSSDVQAPADPPKDSGGRKQPVATKKGLSGAMMRQTVADVFTSGERLGLSGPLLTRYIAGLAEMKGKVDQVAGAITDATERLKPEQAELVRTLPARLLGAMSAGLYQLDPASAGAVISQVLDVIARTVQGRAPAAAEVRGLERLAYAASQLDSAEAGKSFSKAADLLAGKNDALVIEASTKTLVDAIGKISGSGDARDAMLVGVLHGAIRAVETEEAPAEVAAKAAEALDTKLTDGQIQIIAEQAGVARQTRDQLRQQQDQVAQQLEQQQAAFAQALEGDQKEKLEGLAPLMARAEVELSPEGLSQLHGQIAANQNAQSPGTLRAVTAAQLALLGRGSAIPANAVNQVTKLVVGLAQKNVPEEALTALVAQASVAHPVEQVPSVLTFLDQLFAKLGEDGARIAQTGGPAGMAALAGSSGARAVAQRLSENDQAPIDSLVAALKAADDEASTAHVLKNGAQFSAAIPKVEGGPIVENLRKSFAADMTLIGKAGLDAAVLDAATPKLPEDAIPRLVAIGAAQDVNQDQWLADLDKFFANARGGKDHERNLRTLLVCIAESGGDAVGFVRAINGADLRRADVCKLANFMNVETNFGVQPEYVAGVLDLIGKGENPVRAIEQRMNAAVVEKLNLGALLEGAEDVRVTEKGLGDVQGVLAPLFSNGAGNNGVNQDILKGLLKAALADRVDAFRFETPPTEKHLACLTPAQREQWMEPQVMMHIRFQDDGEAIFKQRVERTALIGKAILERLNEAFGQLEPLSKKRDELVTKLRNVDKRDTEARSAIIRELGTLPAKIKALEWATSLAELTADTVTPERFTRLADDIPSLRTMFGPALEDAMEELIWTIRLSDVSYSQVVTDDGPDLPTMFSMTVDRNKTGACLNWPGRAGEGIAYWTDPNKRMIITRNEAGQERRVMMRIVERTDEGHQGEPMLIIEKSYPPAGANKEEKRRLIEHMLRRSSSMGIACGFATEYYWDASQTSRFRGQADADMNEILLDLSKRYGTEVEKKELKVVTRAGNSALEYLDSDAPPGRRGTATYRGWQHNFNEESKEFENEFIVLEPK